MEEPFLKEEEHEEERNSRHKDMLKKEVLRKKCDFSALYKKGKKLKAGDVLVIYNKNNLDYARRAFLASKKVGNSVERNRARRIMKESMRLSGVSLKNGYDFVFIALKSIKGKKRTEIEKKLISSLKKREVVSQ